LINSSGIERIGSSLFKGIKKLSSATTGRKHGQGDGKSNLKNNLHFHIVLIEQALF
jgi:hypothetical protein